MVITLAARPLAPCTTVVPPAAALPDVLPTERLTETGTPVPEIRAELRRIASYRNIGSVALTWAQAIVTVWLAVWIGNPIGYAVAFVLMGPAHARFASLGHEAAHRLLFANKRANDVVGRWLIAYPAFFPFDLYRRVHFAHHKDEFGPNEPDLNLYNGYPITRASFWRKMRRDAVGSSGWKNLKALLRGLRLPGARRTVLGILAAQVPLIVAAVAVGRWWLWPLLWLGPWLTVWRVINRLRAIAEHGGMVRSKDRRLTTHHVRQTWPARFFMVPFNIGWHLAHHVDIGVPWRNLPALERELEAAGWVTDSITWPSYHALWRVLRARPSE
ncbi:MAG TPA: fatty acid desaturase [Mycobacteriales bacterium]|nr:fatty acid desaturase [Mycobacteriales bacterium]